VALFFSVSLINAYDTPWIEKACWASVKSTSCFAMFAASFFLSHSNLTPARSRTYCGPSILHYRRLYGLLAQLPSERFHRRLPQRHTEVFANSLRQIAVGRAAKNFQFWL